MTATQTLHAIYRLIDHQSAKGEISHLPPNLSKPLSELYAVLEHHLKVKDMETHLGQRPLRIMQNECVRIAVEEINDSPLV